MMMMFSCPVGLRLFASQDMAVCVFGAVPAPVRVAVAVVDGIEAVEEVVA